MAAESFFEQTQLPIISIDSLCKAYAAICCRKGTIIELSLTEASFLEANGAELEDANLPPVYDDTADVVETYVYYKMLRDCPFLVQTSGAMALCSIYESTDRPAICHEFKAASAPCLSLCEQVGQQQI